MLGKTFKGMTDEMLAWQTERFLELARSAADDGHVVDVRPEQVVEIAFDGLQRSTRYPGGLALRFARVVRYRDDKRRPRPTRSRRSARSPLADPGRGRTMMPCAPLRYPNASSFVQTTAAPPGRNPAGLHQVTALRMLRRSTVR